MSTFLRKEKVSLLLLSLIIFCCTRQGAEYSNPESAIAPAYLSVDTFNILSANKLKLTIDYCKENYGLNSYKLETPRIIVVHYTAINKLDATFNTFKPDHISTSRDYIKDFSSLNVGIHYVVDQDGKTYNLMPDTIVARHLIGLNHVSLGIENVANDSTDLTDAQIESDAKLIRFLANKYPTIKYMIGHNEYNNKSSPHYKYFKSLNTDYKAHKRSDPGSAYMSKLRKRLADDGLVLEK
jgi:N-acetylmuramoyl-L-alanine amidase